MSPMKLIYQTRHSLNKSDSKFLSIGINVDNWMPLIGISGSNGVCIYLSSEDWEILTNRINTTKINNFFKHGTLEKIQMSGGLGITGSQYNQVNILTFKNSENFYIAMAEVSMTRLFEIAPLINIRRNQIEGLELSSHYTDVLHASIQLGGDAFLNFKDVASALGQFKELNLYCTMELLYMFPEVIVKNLLELVNDNNNNE